MARGGTKRRGQRSTWGKRGRGRGTHGKKKPKKLKKKNKEERDRNSTIRGTWGDESLRAILIAIEDNKGGKRERGSEWNNKSMKRGLSGARLESGEDGRAAFEPRKRKRNKKEVGTFKGGWEEKGKSRIRRQLPFRLDKNRENPLKADREHDTMEGIKRKLNS